VRIITHRGHKILAVDTSGLPSEEIATLHPILARTAIDHKINLVCNFINDSGLDFARRRSTRDAVARARTEVGRLHSAFIGLCGIRKLLANAIQKEHFYAADREEALDWLVKQAEKRR